jgi:transcriptional regulator GlxA family with amidase domain
MRSALNQQSTDITSFIKRPVSDVEIVLFDGFSLPEIAAIIEIFQRANALTRAQSGNGSHFNVSLLSSTGGTILSSSSVPVGTKKTALHQATSSTILLFIAGGTGAKQAASNDRLCKWLRQRHPMSTVVCPVSEGELILAANGLSGRYDVALMNPGIASDMPWQDHSRTAASAIRTALQIPKEELDAEMAKHFARALTPSTRDFPDAALARRLSTLRISDKIRVSTRWLEENADRPITIELAAEAAAMSERNFLRRFKAEIGMTPSDYLQRIRLELSCRMLIESQLPVDKIARRCGIGSGGQLAKLLKKHLLITPTDYRFNKTAPDKTSFRSRDFEDRESLQACA